jgi:hypothetical protein
LNTWPASVAAWGQPAWRAADPDAPQAEVKAFRWWCVGDEGIEEGKFKLGVGAQLQCGEGAALTHHRENAFADRTDCLMAGHGR